MRVNGQDLAADEVLLELDRGPALARDRVDAQLLAGRGFLPYDGLRVFETIVTPDELVEIDARDELWRGRPAHSLRLRRADGGEGRRAVG